MNAYDQSVYPTKARKTSRLIPLRPDRRADSCEPANLICSCAEGWHVIPIADISHCVAQGNYVTIYFGGGRSVLVSKTLRTVEQCLPSDRFVKPHQSYLVAIDQITMFSREELVLTSGQRLPVSRTSRTRLKEAVLQYGVRLG